MLSTIREYNYSFNELVLLKYFDIHPDIYKNIHPTSAWRLMVHTAFNSGEQSEYVDALRRGNIALDSGKIDRMTEEFENLISIFPLEM